MQGNNHEPYSPRPWSRSSSVQPQTPINEQRGICMNFTALLTAHDNFPFCMMLSFSLLLLSMKNCHKAAAGASNICSVPNTTQHVLVLHIDETPVLLQLSTRCSLPIDSLCAEFPPYKKDLRSNMGIQVGSRFKEPTSPKVLGAPWVLA